MFKVEIMSKTQNLSVDRKYGTILNLLYETNIKFISKSNEDHMRKENCSPVSFMNLNEATLNKITNKEIEQCIKTKISQKRRNNSQHCKNINDYKRLF